MNCSACPLKLKINWTRCCHLNTPVCCKLTELAAIEWHMKSMMISLGMPWHEHTLLIYATIVFFFFVRNMGKFRKLKLIVDENKKVVSMKCHDIISMPLLLWAPFADSSGITCIQVILRLLARWCCPKVAFVN